MSPPWQAVPRATLEEGSREHYVEPSYYDKTYAYRREDIAYYVSAAAEAGGPVLEYGCGNGRIAIPMARAGASVVGVDIGEAMLADFRRKMQAEPEEIRSRLRVVRGDMREVRLRKKFSLVLCTFNTFLHLYTRDDVERFLARVRGHLAVGGRFVFDVSTPSATELARDPAQVFRTPPFIYPVSGKKVRYGESFDYDPVRQVLFVTMQFEPFENPEGAWSTLLAHRQFHPCELEALLHYNGFEILKVTSDFSDRPPDRDADSMVWTAVARARRR